MSKETFDRNNSQDMAEIKRLLEVCDHEFGFDITHIRSHAEHQISSEQSDEQTSLVLIKLHFKLFSFCKFFYINMLCVYNLK